MKSKKNLLALALLFFAGVAAGFIGIRTGEPYSNLGTSFAATTNVNVDFNNVIANVADGAVSGTISTYGSEGGNIVNSSKQRQALQNLGLGYYRLPLQWNEGNIVSSAGGGPTDISGDEWVNNIRAIGSEPMIVIGGNSDNDFTPSDAANMVDYYKNSGNQISHWIVGNEPGNEGIGIAEYCTLFNDTYDAMRAVDSTIKIGGPAWAWYDYGSLETFVNCAGSKIDFIDWHHYAMGVSYETDANAMAQTASWGSEVAQIKALLESLVPSRADDIEIQVGEANWSWRTANGYPGSCDPSVAFNGDERFFCAQSTVWVASVLGHVLSNGGRLHQYSDQNGPLGLTFETTSDASLFNKTVGDPMPIYWGMFMYRGGNLFSGIGDRAVRVSGNSISNVDIFAFDNPKRIVLVNKDSTNSHNVNLTLSGADGGSAQIWATNRDNPFDAPALTSDVSYTDSLSVNVEDYSVTTLVLGEQGGSHSLQGDLNNDDVVDIVDLSILLSAWGTTNSQSDINSDGTVDIVDLSILLSNWS